MNIITQRKLEWEIKTWKLNFAIIPFYITISLTAHIIAMRLSSVWGHPIISAAWIYMSIFVFNDAIRSYSKNKKIIYIFVLLEAFCNLLAFTYINLIIRADHPYYAHNIESYTIVFGGVWHIYFANLIGAAIAAVIDVWIFAYLFFKVKINFFFSSIISSFTTLIIYTIITDYFGLVEVYPNHIWNITLVNVITNVIMLIIYSFLGQFFVSWIHNKYLSN